MSLESKANALLDRSFQLAKVRKFFHERCVYEVDTPLLTEYPNLDTHIELFEVPSSGKKRYLHTSPEFGMKRLLSVLKKDIYQMSHVFRAYEEGRKHNPEFMMIEWYRIGKTLDFLIQETLDIIFLFINSKPVHTFSYFELFHKHAGIDLATADETTLNSYLEKNLDSYPENLSFYEKVDLIFSYFVEPKFEGITVIYGFPEWQKALAKLETKNGILEAKRFEIYYDSVELANGYDELLDPSEQENRFNEVLAERIALNKSPYSIDQRFIKALPHIPECVGVAVGFDRLMMIRHKAATITQVIPFNFSEI